MRHAGGENITLHKTTLSPGIKGNRSPALPAGAFEVNQ